jgi:hypothetical protein
MKKSIPIKGLCSTCENAPSCTFPRDIARPIRECEEFIGGEVHAERPLCAAAKPTHDEVVWAPKESAAMLGLCRTCEDWECCTFPKAEGGVWHCEEYK